MKVKMSSNGKLWIVRLVTILSILLVLPILGQADDCNVCPCESQYYFPFGIRGLAVDSNDKIYITGITREINHNDWKIITIDTEGNQT